MELSYNYKGEELNTGNIFRPADAIYFEAPRRPKWKTFLKYSDEWGFDIRNVESNGSYVTKIVLPKGKRLIRYGIDAGSFTTDEGEPYEMLSLPYLKESMPYHEYNVLNECAVLCYVDKGVTAPGFNSKGGAVQYRHYYSLKDSIKLGILEEDLGWLETKKKI